jgi:hypothetical protein
MAGGVAWGGRDVFIAWAVAGVLLKSREKPGICHDFISNNGNDWSYNSR